MNSVGNEECSWLVSAATLSSSMLAVVRAACHLHVRGTNPNDVCNMLLNCYKTIRRHFPECAFPRRHDCESVRSVELWHWQCCTVSRARTAVNKAVLCGTPLSTLALIFRSLTTYIYICRTAALTSRRYILNIYSTNIHTEYFKHAA